MTMLLISVGPGYLWRADRDSRNESAGVYWFLFVESRDFEEWSYDAENSALTSGINYIF